MSWRISYTGRHKKIVIRESLNQCRIVVYKLVIWLSELEKKPHFSFYINESNLETLGSTVHAFTQTYLPNNYWLVYHFILWSIEGQKISSKLTMLLDFLCDSYASTIILFLVIFKLLESKSKFLLPVKLTSYQLCFLYHKATPAITLEYLILFFSKMIFIFF